MSSSRTTMLPRTHPTTTNMGTEANNDLVLRPRSPLHWCLCPTISMWRKRRREPQSEDDFSDSELTDMLDSDHESEDSEDSDYSNGNTSQPPPSEWQTTHVSHIADRIFPALRKHMTKAYYIKPPDYRIPTTRKRRRILLETEDPDNSSTVLIVRVDGYLPLTCPLSRSSCAMQHNNNLRSIPAVIRHLAKHHQEPVYCPVCGAFFDLALSRDAHILARSCAPREFDVARGVSRAQLEELVRGDNPNRREEERWWRIYRVLFPDGAVGPFHPLPPPHPAAYIWDGMPLAVAMAKDYWDCYGRDAVLAYFADEGVAGEMEITEQEVSALCGLVGKELVQRVTSGGLGDEMPKVAGHIGTLDETEWDSVKAEEG